MRKALSLLFVLSILAPLQARAYAFISEYGCAEGKGASWTTMPVVWSLDQRGYSRLDRDTVAEVLGQAFEAWSGPCCSAFRSRYLGLTTETALAESDVDAISFEEEAWPPEFGSVNSTIAVTLPLIYGDCRIYEADMLFNAVGFDFRVDGVVTDLQSIATHEFGHWLGLDHSSASGSSMRAWYSNGIDERTLVPDDENGVCALYPGVCTPCSTDAECATGSICNGSHCVSSRCDVDTDCPESTYCGEGICTPGCRGDEECAGGDICLDRVCQPAPSCDGLWSLCGGGGSCGGETELCIPYGTQDRCTCSCTRDVDCGADARCQKDISGNGFCIPTGSLDECTGIECANGEVCLEGACVDPCAGVACGANETCQAGLCVASCSVDGSCQPLPCGGACGEGEICEEGRCVGGGCSTDADCSGDSGCEGGRCTSASTGESSGCSAGAGGTGLLGVLAGLHSLTWRRRRNARITNHS